MVMVDDSHAVGFVGRGGRGTPELLGVVERVDIVTGTLGKAMGGASGGYIAGRARDRRAAAPALAPLSLLEQHRAAGRRRHAARARPARGLRRAARAAAREHGLVPRADDRARLRHRPRRAPDHPGHAGRRSRWPAASRRRSSTTACTPLASPTRWCRGARRASGRRCRPPSTAPISRWRRRPSSGRRRTSGTSSAAEPPVRLRCHGPDGACPPHLPVVRRSEAADVDPG